MLRTVDQADAELDLRQQCGDSIGVMRVNARTDGVQADGAVHGAGVNVDIAEVFGERLGETGFTGTIFGCLTEYRKADYYQEHPFIEFDTVYGDAKYEVFGAFTIDVVNDTSFIYNQYIDMDEDAYNRYVDQVISRSDVDSGIRPAYGEQLLTLSTCEYSSANGRYVVVARRVSD